MGKKALFAAALAAGAAAVVSNAVLNDTLRRRPPNKDPLPVSYTHLTLPTKA